MKTFLKGIIVGIGGIAPGLSGSVLLVILGLYQKAVNAIATFFKDIKKNFLFLLPLALGMGVGIIAFSKIVDFLLNNFETPTRFTFLGLVIGTIPLFYREVKKEGFHFKYYIVMTVAALAGFALFFFNKDLFPAVENPNLVQSVILGVAYAASSIVPGIDSAVIMSTLGLYETWVAALANLDFNILIPAGFGLAFGILIISFIINFLIKHFYTMTFSVLFGLFISMIPNVLEGHWGLGWNAISVVSVVLMLVGFGVSLFLGEPKENAAKLKKLLRK